MRFALWLVLVAAFSAGLVNAGQVIQVARSTYPKYFVAIPVNQNSLSVALREAPVSRDGKQYLLEVGKLYLKQIQPGHLTIASIDVDEDGKLVNDESRK